MKIFLLLIFIFPLYALATKCPDFLETVSKTQARYWKYHEESGNLEGIWKKREAWRRKRRDHLMIKNAGISKEPIPIFYLEEAGESYAQFSLDLKYLNKSDLEIKNLKLSKEEILAIKKSRESVVGWFRKFKGYKKDTNLLLEETLSLHDELASLKKLNLKKGDFPIEIKLNVFVENKTFLKTRKFTDVQDYRVYKNGILKRIDAITGGGSLYKPSFSRGFIFERELEQSILLGKLRLYRKSVEDAFLNLEKGSDAYKSTKKILKQIDDAISDESLLPSDRVMSTLTKKEMSSERAYKWRSTYKQKEILKGSEFNRFLTIEEHSRLGLKEGGSYARLFRKDGRIGFFVWIVIAGSGGGVVGVSTYAYDGLTAKDKLKKKCAHVECSQLEDPNACDESIPVKKLEKVYIQCLSDKYFRKYYKEEYEKAIKSKKYKPFSDKESSNYKSMIKERVEIDKEFQLWVKELQSRLEARAVIVNEFIEIQESEK
jgi:hypothetical protein